MRRAARASKPSFKTADLFESRREPASSVKFGVTLSQVLSDGQKAVVERRFPALFHVRFQSVGQARWVINEYLPFLEEGDRRDRRFLLNEVSRLWHEIEKKTDFVLREEQRAFLERMKNLRLDAVNGARGPGKDWGRAIAACVALKVRLYVPPKGRRMLKSDLKVPKYWAGMSKLSDAALHESVILHLGSCHFPDELIHSLALNERLIRENGAEQFSFSCPEQRQAFEKLAISIYVKERLLCLDQIARFKAIVGEFQLDLLGSGKSRREFRRELEEALPHALAGHEGQLELLFWDGSAEQAPLFDFAHKGDWFW